jgi:hypothetical protein
LPPSFVEFDIDRKIREREEILNLPKKEREREKFLFKVTQRVRFRNPIFSAFWGEGTIFEIASEARIGLWVDQLFGSAGKVFVPASEIEAM